MTVAVELEAEGVLVDDPDVVEWTEVELTLDVEDMALFRGTLCSSEDFDPRNGYLGADKPAGSDPVGVGSPAELVDVAEVVLADSDDCVLCLATALGTSVDFGWRTGCRVGATPDELGVEGVDDRAVEEATEVELNDADDCVLILGGMVPPREVLAVPLGRRRLDNEVDADRPSMPG